MRFLVLSIGLASLAACSPVTGPRWPDLAPCGAHELQHLVGRPLAELEALELAQPVRVVPPELSVTMDVLPERLNADVNEAGTILRLSCG